MGSFLWLSFLAMDHLNIQHWQSISQYNLIKNELISEMDNLGNP